MHERREIDRYGLSDLYEISRLERVDDAYLASPIGLHNLISFPWGIYEAKRAYSDDTTDRTAWYVYIQVARAMTMCAASLEKISEVSRDPEGGAQPVLGFTSIGPKWSLFLCYRYHGEGPTPFWVSSMARFRHVTLRLTRTLLQHVSQIWEGNLTHRRDTLQLLAIVDCAKSWATNQFEPWISERLERIYQLPPSLQVRNPPGSNTTCHLADLKQSAPVVHLSSPMKGTPRPTPIKSPKRSPRKATPPRLIAIRPQEPQPPITGSPRPRRPTANRISMISNSSEEESYGTADEGDDPIYPPLLFPSTTSDDPIYPSLLFSSTTSDLEEGLSLSLARLSFDPGPSSPPDEFLRFQPPNTANSSRRKVPMAPRRVRLSDTPIPGELPV